MNRDSATAVTGCFKAIGLAGTIFNHKDDKKGQQDSVQAYVLSMTQICFLAQMLLMLLT